VPLVLVLPLEGLGLFEAISIVKVFLYPFLWFFVLFDLVGSLSKQLLLPAITILLCREPSLSQMLRHTWYKLYALSRHTHEQMRDERETRNRKVILVLVSWWRLKSILPVFVHWYKLYRNMHASVISTVSCIQVLLYYTC
jgi:hypothetical protein